MRVAVLSDIHANWQALEAVARDTQEQGIDETWCLGDVVGYGAHPREALDWVERHAKLLVKGNHDHAVATGETNGFNNMAADAARFHAQMLNPVERARIFGWPLAITHESPAGSVLLVHASPEDPLHEYVLPHQAKARMGRWADRAEILLVGHTHMPFSTRNARPNAWTAAGFESDELVESEGPGLILNPGSVGQPRDGDARASYAILDLARRHVELRRVPYDVEAAAQAIRRAGLGITLALRLYHGR